MISALEALELLREGNRRFVADVRSHEILTGHARRRELATGQEPLAIILGCSDSRVPAELVFDQGLGDLFVIRVAGNIVAPSQVGSVEFAAARYGTRLVVVLGHSSCGAILATLEEVRRRSEDQSRNLRTIVDRIRPSVEALLSTDLGHDEEALVRQAVRANIRASADHLRHGSEVLEQLIQNEGLLVVGAEYSLETGVVDFFDGVPAVANRAEASGHQMLPLHDLLACATLTVVGLVEPAGRAWHRPCRRPAPVRRREGTRGRQTAGRRPWPARSELHRDGHPAGGAQRRRLDGPGPQPPDRRASGARCSPNLKQAQGQSARVYSGGPVSTDGVAGAGALGDAARQTAAASSTTSR